MNLPNMLTIFRIIIIPFIMFFLMNQQITGNMYIALLLFIIACITDFLDGFIARKYKLITNFGKFLDPVADKVLIICVLICFVELNYPNVWWVLAIIVTRELAVTCFRILAADKNVVIAANIYGKFKTNAQMLWTILLFFKSNNEYFLGFRNCMMYLTAILTVVSFVIYLYENKSVLK